MKPKTEKILLVITFPLWIIPKTLYELGKAIWEDISDYVDERRTGKKVWRGK